MPATMSNEVRACRCPKCEGDYNPSDYKPGVCRHCIPDVPAATGKTLCVDCFADHQICRECGYPEGS